MRDIDDPDAGAREVLRLLGPDPQNWVPERIGADGHPIDHNVVIVGGGQSGCAFAWALRRAGPVGYTMVVLNMGMLFSIPVFGGHYLVDAIAGAAT